MYLSALRKPVDTYAPWLGEFYRQLRDQTTRQQSIPTKYGFTLAGDPSMASDGWEEEEVKAFADLLGKHEVVLDIGANVGFYSCLAARHGKPVLSFEPAPRNLEFLYRNLSENGFSNVEVYPLGLANRCGLGKIYGFGGITSCVPGWAQARESRSRLVPLTTLDTLVSARFRKKKLLIKMDVEGFELDVLSGAKEMLELEPKPTWLVEILLRGAVIPGGTSNRFLETFEVFWSHGYRCCKLDTLRSAVGPSDVSRWVANGRVDDETRDFIFSAE